MTLTFDLQGHRRMLCPLVDYMGVHVKTIMPYEKYLDSYGDFNAFAV